MSRMLGFVAVVLVSLIVLIASPWRGGFGFAYMGVVPGIAAVIASTRVAFLSAVTTAGAVLVGVTVSGSVPLSVLWMTVLAVGIVYASRYGASSVGCMITAQAAIVIVYGRVYAGAPEPFNQPHTFAGALPVAAFALGGGLVVALAGQIFLRQFPGRLGDELSVHDSWWYGASVIPLTILGTWVCRAFFPGTHSWWFLLTVYVVLLPVSVAAIDRMRGRVIGTVAGATFVAIITFVVAEAELSVNIIYGLALIAAVGTIVFAHGSYTLDAAFLTATVLLGGFGSANNPTLLHGERVGLTILGAAAAFGALRFNDWLRARVDQRPEVTT